MKRTGGGFRGSVVNVVCLDTSFIIDLLNGDPAAVEKAGEIDSARERKTIAPPAAAEVLFGAALAGGEYERAALELLSTLELLEFNLEACEEAGRIFADLHRRGEMIGTVDILIAAVCKLHKERLLTRDKSFTVVRGLVVETY